MFEYKVKAKHKLGYKEFIFYADTDIEEFLNRNNIEYVRNMTDTVEHRQLKEIERLKEENTILKQTMCDNSLLINENALLKSIIKEVREYIERYLRLNLEAFDTKDLLGKILEILDKVGETDVED